MFDRLKPRFFFLFPYKRKRIVEGRLSCSSKIVKIKIHSLKFMKISFNGMIPKKYWRDQNLKRRKKPSQNICEVEFRSRISF